MRDPENSPERGLTGKDRFFSHLDRVKRSGGIKIVYDDGSRKLLIPGKRAGVPFIERTLYGGPENYEVLCPTEEHFSNMGVYNGLRREMEAAKE